MKYAHIPFYRTLVSTSLKSFRVVYKETDLLILAEKELVKESLFLVREVRLPLETYIAKNPFFLKSLEPLPYDEEAPEMVQKMLKAGKVAGVGPMASVAGAIAEKVGTLLIKEGYTSEVVVENGGDIYLNLKRDAKVAIFAGESTFSGKIALKIKKGLMPCGVCTSSGKVGHSLSWGKAEAITVIHKDTALADALATAFGNMLKSSQDFQRVITKAKRLENLWGLFCIVEDQLMLWGKNIELETL
ncbi:MAG: UPF0280 family protein [Caldimicrobium sp.]|nr:UPF0280 family protein [Caldimicrobium sp.]